MDYWALLALSTLFCHLVASPARDRTPLMLLEDIDNMPVEREKRAMLVMCNPDQTFFCINTTHYSPCQHVVLEDDPPSRGLVQWCGVRRCCRPGINSPCTHDCDDQPVIPVLVGESTEKFESGLQIGPVTKKRIIVKAFLVDNDDDNDSDDGSLSGGGFILADDYPNSIEGFIYSDNYDYNSGNFYDDNGPHSTWTPSYRTKCPALAINRRRAFAPSLDETIKPIIYTSPSSKTSMTGLKNEINPIQNATEVSETSAQATISFIDEITKISEIYKYSHNAPPVQESAMIHSTQTTSNTTLQKSEMTGYNELSSDANNDKVKTTVPINGRDEYNNAIFLKNSTITPLPSTSSITNMDSDEKNPISVTNLASKISQKWEIPSPYSTQMYSAAMATSRSNEYTTYSTAYGSTIDRYALFQQHRPLPTVTPLCQEAGDFRYKISCTRYIHCSWNHGRLIFELMRCPFYQEFDSNKKRCVPAGLSDCAPTSLSDQDVIELLGDKERDP